MARDTLIGGALWEEYSNEVQRRMNDPINMGEITQEEEDKAEKRLIIADFGAESCGDAVRLYWMIDPKNDVIIKSRFKSFGCGTAIASSDMMAELCMEKTVDEALKITNIDDEIVIDQHCMSPDYLRWSAQQSLANLGLETIDIFFLHNPETQLGYVDVDTLYDRIYEAFKVFEELRKEGKIVSYGIASWNGFLYEEDHPEYLSLAKIVEMARNVGGDNHGFKYLQSPFNLAKHHAYSYRNQRCDDGLYYPLMHACARYEISYLGSSPLLQKNLFKRPFSSKIGELMQTDKLSDVASALQFARSAGAICSIFGAVNPSHVVDNAILGYVPCATTSAINTLVNETNAV